MLSLWLTSSMEAKNHSAEHRLEPIVDAFSSAHDALSPLPEDQALFCYYAYRKQKRRAYAGKLSLPAFGG
jgi:hypothetical protein